MMKATVCYMEEATMRVLKITSPSSQTTEDVQFVGDAWCSLPGVQVAQVSAATSEAVSDAAVGLSGTGAAAAIGVARFTAPCPGWTG